MAIAKDKYVKYDQERADWIKSVLNEFVREKHRKFIAPIKEIVGREKAKVDERIKNSTDLKSSQIKNLEQYKKDLDYAFGNLSCQAVFGYHRAATSEYKLIQVEGEDYIKEEYYQAFVDLDKKNKQENYHMNTLKNKIEFLTMMHDATEEADWELEKNYE